MFDFSLIHYLYFITYTNKLLSKLHVYSSGEHVRVMFTPLNPTFYIAKLGFAGVYLFFLFLLQNIDCGYSLELPRRGGSNVYPQSML